MMRMHRTRPALWVLVTGILALLLTTWSPAKADEPAQSEQTLSGWSALIYPQESFSFRMMDGMRPVLELHAGGWGPGWAWALLSSQKKAPPGGDLDFTAPFVVNRQRGQIIKVHVQAGKSGPQSVAYRYELSNTQDVPLTMLTAQFAVPHGVHARVIMTDEDGKDRVLPLPAPGFLPGKPVAKLRFQIQGVGEIQATVVPARPIVSGNGDLRLMLAGKLLKQGTSTTTVTFTMPGPVQFLASQQDINRLTREVPGPDWFPFTLHPAAPGARVFDMSSWLDKPAGKHGGVRMVGDRFEFADGTPVKFWGTNLAYAYCAPPKKDAPAIAQRFARYGINAVRLHKFCGPNGWEGIANRNDATKMNPEGLDRLDYFCAQLKADGIYYGWSPTYRFVVEPGNRGQLVAYDEIAKYLKGDTYGLINLAPDVQNLMIERVVNLLKHKNPYTGLTYAQDPALCYIELQNEDDIFWWNTASAMTACPTYKKLFAQEFSDWLKAKYGTQQKLKAAWGAALPQGQSLEARNILPAPDLYGMSEEMLPHAGGGDRQRKLDIAQYLHQLQNEYYGRFVKAIRDAGYQGPLCGSNWQAPSGLPHYYNLRSDYLVGFIDRHNYFGGWLKSSMLPKPGSGYLSTGLQQVIDRPFTLSEWITQYPSLYSAEGPVLVAAYGMGLQGWDASYEYQSFPSAGLAPNVGRLPWGLWNVDVPNQIGQYPVLSRMVLRGDVKQAPIISTRRVNLADLRLGKFNFTDKIVQHGDVKTFGGNVPAEALAAGRCVVEFTNNTQPSTFPDMAQYRHGSQIDSATGQLAWHTDGKGFVTINTDATKGVVGFAQDREIKLGNVTITERCPYASVLVTALDKKATLDTDKSALVSAVASNMNSGMKVFTVNNSVLDDGKDLILVQPVKATIRMTRPIAQVNVLDPDGRRTGKVLAVQDGQFTIDTGVDKTIYYEVVFK